MDINRVDGSYPNRSQRVSSSPPTPQSSPRSRTSPQERMRKQLRGFPGIRVDRVAEIRKAIESGKYDEGKRLDAAIERMMDELG